MTKQLTPAEELRMFHRALTILAEKCSSTMADCPDPEKFDPDGACASPSTDLCGKCFRNYAINRAMQEMEARHD